jgi:hypothetical protein
MLVPIAAKSPEAVETWTQSYANSEAMLLDSIDENRINDLDIVWVGLLLGIIGARPYSRLIDTRSGEQWCLQIP